MGISPNEWRWCHLPPSTSPVLQFGRAVVDALQGGSERDLMSLPGMCTPGKVKAGRWMEKLHSLWSLCPQKVENREFRSSPPASCCRQSCHDWVQPHQQCRDDSQEPCLRVLLSPEKVLRL